MLGGVVQKLEEALFNALRQSRGETNWIFEDIHDDVLCFDNGFNDFLTDVTKRFGSIDNHFDEQFSRGLT